MAVQEWMNQMLEVIADLGRNYLENPRKKYSLASVEEMCKTLLSRKGEASGTALAKEIVDAFNKMTSVEKTGFLLMLTENFGPNPETISQAAQEYLKHQDIETLYHLSRAVETPRLELLRLLNIAPGGTSALVEMREILLQEIKKNKVFGPLENDLIHLLTSWFNRGFLQFERIDWNTPAVILEKLIAHEAVHEIKGWPDLRRRLAEDRRCFAFFHPALHNDPLIFVEVAFSKGVASNIEPLLSLRKTGRNSPQPDTAIFYSISNCQDGLKGISFGNFLIKQVVDSINHEMPHIKNYCTLSPIPNFLKWLNKDYLKRKSTVFSKAELKLIEDEDWFSSASVRQSLKSKLLPLCARYLSQEKKRNRPFDPVTRFHLGNGAEIEKINWGADLSPRGLSQSAGLMVNYRYNPAKIVSNHESYVNDGRIAISSKVKKMIQ
ncbi:MAG: malonyl-CoA decarboxylase [Deltaproteobacteria bacterium]|jgi:malonyl-CoA decarboxylase|nr:malonyl-CoA decarboxylase [Deltaproteobacteria bacterium]MBT4263161.1 malonyl-CoA decarboxylase [Deltaproteobacteria bacterium]MBT4641954.1 malonyl-CoA decarboxylase [Deltaproteobacteria bacterium]MBT6502984.1 malonyl-CoA decarboxylase [Deltaproteobacteria bacterium]MBT6613351.1 malonyl-CoA decarboxylase [Deltaproteobacteria bacterium]